MILNKTVLDEVVVKVKDIVSKIVDSGVNYSNYNLVVEKGDVLNIKADGDVLLEDKVVIGLGFDLGNIVVDNVEELKKVYTTMIISRIIGI